MTEQEVGAGPVEEDAGGVMPEVESPRSVIDELRGLGEHFAAAMRAAAGTPEAEALKGDIQTGLRDLRVEIDRGLQSAKASTSRAPGSGKAVDQVRVELASALRSLNRVLERAAESMARSGGTAEPAPEADVPPRAEDEI